MKKKILCLINLFQLLHVLSLNAISKSKNTWLPRSFSSYMSRSLILEEPLFQKVDSQILSNQTISNQVERSCLYDDSGTFRLFSFAFEYMESFGGCNSTKNVGSMPFWSGSNVLKVGNNDGDADVDAYQFGLGNIRRDADGKTLLGSLYIDPEVKHLGTEGMLYFSQHKDQPGWFCKINIPLGAMIVHPNLKEIDQAIPDKALVYEQETSDPGSSTIEYNFVRYPPPSNRHRSIVDSFLAASNDISRLNGDVTKFIKLRQGRIFYNKKTMIRISDITASVGCNVFANEKSFLGIGFKFSCPTGNVPKGEFMLEPIFGRSGLWGVGFETIGHYRFLESDTYHCDISMHSELLTLQPGRVPSYRSFDLKQNGLGSKYLLIQYYPATYSAGNAILAPQTFRELRVGDSVSPAVNITTLPVNSSFNLEGSVACNIMFCKNNWSVGLALDAWGRTEEKLSIDSCRVIDERFPNLNDYAVLGRQLSSYNVKDQGIVSASYCEPLARINKSQNPVALVGAPPAVTAATILPDGIADARLSQNRIPANIDDAIDIASAQNPSVVTIKLVTQCNYQFKDRKYQPILGLTSGVEFNPRQTNNAVQYVSIGLHGSLLF